MLKIRNYLNYKSHVYLCVQRETNAFFGRLQMFREVWQSCNMLQLDVGSLSPVCKCVLTIVSVTILHKCAETSLTVTRIAISLTLN